MSPFRRYGLCWWPRDGRQLLNNLNNWLGNNWNVIVIQHRHLRMSLPRTLICSWYMSYFTPIAYDIIVKKFVAQTCKNICRQCRGPHPTAIRGILLHPYAHFVCVCITIPKLKRTILYQNLILTKNNKKQQGDLWLWICCWPLADLCNSDLVDRWLS